METIIDMFWVLICGILVMLMQAGFCCLEAGSCRSKNSINIALKNLADFCMTGCLFWAVGYGLMHGVSRLGFWGTSGFFFSDYDDPKSLTKFFFQLVFAGTATTIISGAVAERIKFVGYLLVVLWVSFFVYPIFGHWVWHENGWLKQIGYIDFAGSSVVHGVGGWVALAVVLIIGPRRGRFSNAMGIEGFSMPLAILGLLLIWFGWFGFNGGSLMGADERVPLVIVNTCLAGSLGGLTSMFMSWWIHKRPRVGFMINGVLAGLVAVTASCHVVTPAGAMIIGGVGAAVAVGLMLLLNYMRIDDVVGAFPVHAGAGVWGVLAVAFFGDRELLETGLTFGGQLEVQAIGCLVVFVWAFLLPFFTFWVLNLFFSLRVKEEDEIRGLNLSEHGAQTELYALLNEMEYQKRSGDYSQPVKADPYSEYGLVAAQYNRVVSKVRYDGAVLKKMNLELQTQKDRVEKTSAAKSQFLESMGHDLLSPLNTIASYTELLREEYGELGKSLEIENGYLEGITDSTDKLAGLIRKVLELVVSDSVMCDVEQSVFSVHRFTQQLASTYELCAHKKGLLFDVEIAEDVPMVGYTNEVRLRHIVSRLLINALKYTKEGRVGMYVTSKIDENSQRRLCIDISDTGCGMATDTVMNLFELPDSINQDSLSFSGETGDSSGLSMPLILRLSELLGGGICVKSDVGSGTTFTVDVNIEKNIAPKSNDIDQDFSDQIEMGEKNAINNVAKIISEKKYINNDGASESWITGTRDRNVSDVKNIEKTDTNAIDEILVIDDSEENCGLMKNFLDGSIYKIEFAKNGLEGYRKAIDKYKLNQTYSVIFMDILMPVMDGYTVTRELRRIGYKGIIIALTAIGSPNVESKCRASGCDDFAKLPITRGAVIKLVHKYAHKGIGKKDDAA